MNKKIQRYFYMAIIIVFSLAISYTPTSRVLAKTCYFSGGGSTVVANHEVCPPGSTNNVSETANSLGSIPVDWATKYVGIRITMYAYDKDTKQPQRISQSRDFKTQGSILPSGAYRSGYDKITYMKDKKAPSYSTNAPAIGDMTDLPSLFGSQQSTFKETFYRLYAGNENDNTVPAKGVWLQSALQLDKSLLDGGNYDSYYYVIEPLMTFDTGSANGGRRYVVTAYEAAVYFSSGTGTKLTNISSYVPRNLGNNSTVSSASPYDKLGFIPDYITPIGPNQSLSSDGQTMRNQIKNAPINGWGMGIYWKKYEEPCGKEHKFFPIDPTTGKVQPVNIQKNSSGVVTVTPDPGGKLCCQEILTKSQKDGGYDNDESRFYKDFPMCAPNTCKPNIEQNPSSCNGSGKYYETADNYCIKAQGDYSPYLKRRINEYARINCKEELDVKFPKGLNKAQSVGTYMVWPTAKELGINNNYTFDFSGSLTCYLSLDGAIVDGSGNSSQIYNDILNAVRSYVNPCASGSCEAKSWYNINNNIDLALNYNDDEYGGPKVNLILDQTNTVVTSNVNSLQPTKDSLNSLVITVATATNYRLEDNTYKKLTTSGTGSTNLSNMFNNQNKNQFVNGSSKMITYPILPISFKATPLRNMKNIPNNRYSNPKDAYGLSIYYRRFGDNGKFVNQEQTYTCNYEVTFAPPRQTGEEPGQDNNDPETPVLDVPACSCNPILPNGQTCPYETRYMDLTGYLAKNPGKSCEWAQLKYCPNDRGSMNVEYRVIDLNHPFPGISGATWPNSRTIGSNWRESLSQYNAIDNPNSMVNQYIRNNRGVSGHNLYISGERKPLYIIELTPSTINVIREYNKRNDYADFTLNCRDQADGQKCVSETFLRGTIGYALTGGTCSGILTTSDFLTCANKLETDLRGKPKLTP